MLKSKKTVSKKVAKEAKGKSPKKNLVIASSGSKKKK